MRNGYAMIVFDWDGTLVDSVPRIVSSLQHAAMQIGLPSPSCEAIKAIIGLSLEEATTALFPQLDEQTQQALLAGYRQQFLHTNPTPMPLFAHCEALLAQLKQQGLRLAIATGKSRKGLEAALAQTGLGHWFADSICGGEAASKPSAEMLIQLCQRQQLQRTEVLMVGDARFDLQMALNANIDAIGISHGAATRAVLSQHAPLTVVDDLVQLAAWLAPA